jgi:spermidine synthase/MFS family permease
MPAFPAAALVFLSSAAVLVLEILAARLMAPYVGVTLEVYTAIIGVVLAGIAVGSWLGGRAADRVDPRGMVGPLLIVGGILAFLSLPLVDGLGGGLRGATAGTTTLLTFLGFFAPAAVLSAVTPAIIKLRLASLDETGRVVGRLSAISTAGAIVGTFITGFVLVAAWPSRPVVRVVAVSLVLLGIGVSLWLRRARPLSVGSVIAAVLAGLFSFAASHPCEHESAYYCAYIEQDPDRESGRALWLDTLRHSYVDLEDPSHLEFTYMQWFGDVLTALAPEGEPLEVLHVGGAGFTMPQYLREEHPGSTSTVLELDELLVELAVEKLGLELDDDIEVLTGDARLGIRRTPQDAYDVVIGDAFGGVAVPWHLTTVEFLEQVEARLTADGVYVMNLVDYAERGFLRAQAATVAAVFDHIAVIAAPDSFGPSGGTVGGNFVLVASHQQLPVDGIRDANAARARDDEILTGAQLDEFVGDAEVLTDDHAPVDQLLTPLPIAR